MQSILEQPFAVSLVGVLEDSDLVSAFPAISLSVVRCVQLLQCLLMEHQGKYHGCFGCDGIFSTPSQRLGDSCLHSPTACVGLP